MEMCYLGETEERDRRGKNRNRDSIVWHQTEKTC